MADSSWTAATSSSVQVEDFSSRVSERIADSIRPAIGGATETPFSLNIFSRIVAVQPTGSWPVVEGLRRFEVRDAVMVDDFGDRHRGDIGHALLALVVIDENDPGRLTGRGVDQHGAVTGRCRYELSLLLGAKAHRLDITRRTSSSRSA